jgi:hypothetical protein
MSIKEKQMNDVTLRELIIGRIVYACSDNTLLRDYGLTEEVLYDLRDLDLFEMFEMVMDSVS